MRQMDVMMRFEVMYQAELHSFCMTSCPLPQVGNYRYPHMTHGLITCYLLAAWAVFSVNIKSNRSLRW